MAKQSIEEVILAIEKKLAEIDARFVENASNRAEDLKVTQDALELFKSQFADMQGQLDTVNERLKRLEARSR